MDDVWSTRRSQGLEKEIVGLASDRVPRRLGKALRSQQTVHLSGGDIVRVLWDDGVESTHRSELLSLATADELEHRKLSIGMGDDARDTARPPPGPTAPGSDTLLDVPAGLVAKKTILGSGSLG